MKPRNAGTHKGKDKPTAPRGPRSVNSTVVIQITLTEQMASLVDNLVATGLFGNSRAAGCERLLSSAVQERLKSGIIQAAEKARGE